MRPRKSRASRLLGVTLVCTLVAGVAVAVGKFKRGSEPTPLLAVETSSKQIPKPSNQTPPAVRSALLTTTQTRSAGAAAPASTGSGAATRPAGANLNPVRVGPAASLTPGDLKPLEPPARVGVSPLAESQALMDRGELITARAILNDAMNGGKLSGTDFKTAKERAARINESVVFGRRMFKEDTYGGVYTVRSGEKLQTIARNHGVSWEFLARINGIADPKKLRALQTLKVVRGPFHAVVDKRSFTMDIYLGSPGGAGAMYVTSFRVGLGKDNSTPGGRWVAHNKLKNPEYYSPRGEGIIDADDPRNPLGEYWVGLRGVDGAALGSESYGIHGTVEPDSIGKEESMGCIRLVNEDAGRVFELLVEGKSEVVVRE